MARSPKPALTRLELKVMQAVWKLGSSQADITGSSSSGGSTVSGGCTVSDVQQHLHPPLAYTTVQTMLNILERKGQLRRQLRGRAYLYTAAVSETKAVGQGVRDLVDRMFGGSAEDLVMSLLQNRQIDAKTLAELTERFNNRAGES